jgi:hypothetical protein
VGVGSGGVGDGEPVDDGLTDGAGGGGEAGVGTGGVTHVQVELAVTRGLVANTAVVAGRRGGGLGRVVDVAVVGDAAVGVAACPSATAGSGSSAGAARSSSRAPRPPTTAK